jgi:hypothetical protein
MCVGHRLDAFEICPNEDQTAVLPDRAVEREARGEPLAEELPDLSPERGQATDHDGWVPEPGQGICDGSGTLAHAVDKQLS